MKLKLDENGNAVVQDGMPVYEYEDGTEQPFDAAQTVSNFENKIANLTDEKDRHFNDKKAVEDKLKAFGRLTPQKAKEYASTVKKLEGQKLVDEHGLEQYQKQWTEEVATSLNEEHQAKEESWLAEKENFEGTISNLQGIVYDQAVNNQFANHPYFSGDKPKTFYKPEHAAKIYGGSFKVDIGENKKLKVYAVDPQTGKTLLSKKNHGEPASFNEAVELIVQQDAEHHDIFRAPARRGPGVAGNLDGATNAGPGVAGKEKIKAGLKKYYNQYGQ